MTLARRHRRHRRDHPGGVSHDHRAGHRTRPALHDGRRPGAGPRRLAPDPDERALLGPAGSGKTAIVEGLAIRIANGAVPAQLADVRIFDVPLLSLAAAIKDEPGLLGDFLVEVRHPSAVVFFDEVHLLAAPAVHDLAESLKPALARGEIACIGATTADEYQAFIEPETALARRFTEIAIEPMGEAAVRAVLVAVRDKLAAVRGIPVTDAALTELRPTSSARTGRSRTRASTSSSSRSPTRSPTIAGRSTCPRRAPRSRR